MRLADAGRTEQDNVLGALDEGEPGELVYLLAWNTGGKPEVKAVERLDRRETGDPGDISRARTRRASRSARKISSRKSAKEAAFAAASFLMDYLKTRAPFWKQVEKPSGKNSIEKTWVEAKATDDAAAERWAAPPPRRDAAK